jgi:hypothetical protein
MKNGVNIVETLIHDITDQGELIKFTGCLTIDSIEFIAEAGDFKISAIGAMREECEASVSVLTPVV